jgi:hypothetical protein
MDQDKLTDALSKLSRKKIPDGSTIVKEAMRLILSEKGFNGDVSWLKANFSMLVEDVQVRAFDLYLGSQAPAADEAFRALLGPMLPAKPTKDEFFDLLRDNFEALDGFFLSLGQGRKARAGGAMEQVLETLIVQLGYPYTAQPKIDGQPDFLFPSVEHFGKMPVDCIIFTVKRTLRERWRQVVTEGSKGLQFFLATIDEKILPEQLETMKAHRVSIVVPARIKSKCYPNVHNALSFEDFFEHHLDPAMVRWKKTKVIR